MANPIVIDCSHWNPDPIDWAKLKANGTVGIVHKATEGESYVDNKLFARAAAAMEAGLCWSTYHFLRPSSNMMKQLQHYGNTIDPVLGERVCLDHEDPGVSLADLEECVRLIKGKRPDLQICIYSGHVIKEQLGGNRSAILAENTSLWIAQYASKPTWPTATWPQWSLWQHTDKATAVGINGPIDANKWNGDEAGLRAWFGPADQTPVPEPEPRPEPVASLTVAPGSMVVINGIEVIAE